LCVCVSACPCACPLTDLRNHASKIHQICNTRYPWPWLGPLLAALRYVMSFRFMDNVVFPYMTLRIHVDTVAATSLKRSAQANAPAALCWLRPVLETTAVTRTREPFVQGCPGPWASADRGKWGQLTPLEKMDEKLKSENMQYVVGPLSLSS